MATTRDLLGAQAFQRRRLATAFVSGARGAGAAEPPRPGRAIAGGVVLALLLVAGVALAGVLAPPPSDDWQREGLVVSQDTGAAYVVLEDGEDLQLRPVLNAVSAALVLGGVPEPTLVAQDLLDEQPLGTELGLTGAPAEVPEPEALVDSGWTACAADGAGVRVRIADHPDTEAAPGHGVTVTHGGDVFVVVPRDDDPAGAVLLPVGPQGDQTDNLLAALHLQSVADAVPVPRGWLDLFPLGAPLDRRSLGVAGHGAPAGYSAGHRIGDLLVAGDERLLLTRRGPVALSDFEAAVYAHVVGPDGRVAVPRVVDRPPGVPRVSGPDTGWPDTVPVAAVDEPCAELGTGAPAAVHLRRPGPAAAAAAVPAGETEVAVAPGSGAHLRVRGTAYLVDGRGRAHPLDDDAADSLGYGDHRPAVVPGGWLRLLGCGVALSRDTALAPSDEQDDPECP